MDIGSHRGTIIETLEDRVMVIDIEGNIMSTSPAAERLTGYSASYFLSRKFWRGTLNLNEGFETDSN
jgi:PAS domain S-box-containing protein